MSRRTQPDLVRALYVVTLALAPGCYLQRLPKQTYVEEVETGTRVPGPSEPTATAAYPAAEAQVAKGALAVRFSARDQCQTTWKVEKIPVTHNFYKQRAWPMTVAGLALEGGALYFASQENAIGSIGLGLGGLIPLVIGVGGKWPKDVQKTVEGEPHEVPLVVTDVCGPPEPLPFTPVQLQLAAYGNLGTFTTDKWGEIQLPVASLANPLRAPGATRIEATLLPGVNRTQAAKVDVDVSAVREPVLKAARDEQELAKRRRSRRKGVQASEVARGGLALASDPARPERVYLVSADHKLWLSDDSGQRWKEAVSVGGPSTLTGISVGANGAVLGLAADGAWASLDGGETWSPVGASTGVPLAAAVDPVDPMRFRLATASSLLYTEDGGATFSTEVVDGRVVDLAADPAGAGLWYALVAGVGVMALDANESWKLAFAHDGVDEGMFLVHTRDRPDQVVIGLPGGTVMASKDRGTTFSAFDQGLKWESTEHLALLARDPVDLALLAVSDAGRVFRRTGDDAWAPAGTVSGLPSGKITWASIESDSLSVATPSGVVRLDLAPVLDKARTEGGATRVFTAGPNLSGGIGMVADPAAPGHLLALAQGGGVWTSDDAGRHFTAAPPPPGVGGFAVRGGSGWVVAGPNGAWLRAGDGWTAIDVPGTGNIVDLAADPSGTWVLREDGLVWFGARGSQAFPIPGAARVSIGGNGEPWVTTTESGVKRWDGSAWLDTGAPAGTRIVVADPTTSQRAFAATGDAVYRFEADSGWSPTAPLPAAPVTLAIDPADRSVLVACVDGSIFRSAAGERWRPLGEHLPPARSLLAVDGAVHLLAEDGSTWRLSRVAARERLSSEVFFQTGASTLTSAGQAALEPLLPRLAGREVRIEGHTDNVGSAALNEKLSRERAESVASYLTAHGIAPTALSTEGFGPRRPVGDNATDTGRARNRRVEILVLD